MSSLVMGVTLQRIYSSAASTLLEQHMREVSLLARSIDFELESMARIARDTASFLQIDPQFNDAELYALLHANAGSHAMIYGAAIAFEPYAYKSDRRLFAPYVFDRDLKQVDLSTLAEDYTEAGTPWYGAIKATGVSRWTEPYFDTGAGTMPIATYATPLLRGDAFIGVTTLDLRLDQLTRNLASLLDERQFMIMSPSGRFVSHHDPAMILAASIQDEALRQGSAEYDAMVSRIMKGERGFSAIAGLRQDGSSGGDTDDDRVEGNTWVFHTPITATNWHLATFIAEDELMDPLTEQINIALLGMSLTILLIFGLVWLVSSRLTRPIKQLEAAVSD
ncbi:MAG TPA: hypothetical protein GX696_04045, partial [Pseudomonadaceae bacterium]|nr:hypothetical protein [Pseudomonadaceae bacterium]